MSVRRVSLDVFADYVCPYCRLAEPALRELMAEDDALDVRWRSFELRPGTIPPLDPNADYLRDVWQGRVLPLAQRLGVPMTQPPVQPRTRRTHEAAHWARAAGHFDAFHNAVLAAFFERGEDIGEIDVLVGLADALGLQGADLRQALVSRAFEQAVIDDEEEAKELDVGSVPAFVADGRFGVIGVQTVEVLRDLVQQARAAADAPAR